MDFQTVGSIVLSAAFFAGLILIVVKLAPKAVRTREYDERQMLARLRAYRTAFWATGAYLLLNGAYYTVEERSWADPMLTGFIGLCVGIMVFAVVCILGDAYFAVNDNPKRNLLLLGGVTMLNVGITIMNWSDGRPFVENGMLTFHCMNALCVVMLFILLLAVCIKLLLNKRAEK